MSARAETRCGARASLRDHQARSARGHHARGSHHMRRDGGDLGAVSQLRQSLQRQPQLRLRRHHGHGPDAGDHHRRHRSVGGLRDGTGRHCDRSHASGRLSVMDRSRCGDGGRAAVRPHQWLCDRQVQAVAFRRHADHAVGGAQPGAGGVQQQDDLPVRPGREAVRRARRRQPVRRPLRRDRYGGDRHHPHARHGEHKLGPIRLRDWRQRAGGAA